MKYAAMKLVAKKIFYFRGNVIVDQLANQIVVFIPMVTELVCCIYTLSVELI